jgi:DNA-binding transcriptional LysR family regulator
LLPRSFETQTLPLGLDLRHLRYFLAVADELHFGRAAQRLHLAQPALSQAVRKLEEGLEVQLLDRNSRSVALTRAGAVFAQETRRILAEVDAAVAETRRAGGVGTVLRIGHVPMGSMHQLAQFLRSLYAAEPEVSVEVRHLYSLEQVARLQSWELDLGFMYPAGDHDHVELEPAFPGSPLVALLPARHRLAGKESLTPDDLRREDLVFFPRRVNPTGFDRVLAEVLGTGYSFRNVFQTAGPQREDLMFAVAAGHGIGLVPFGLVEEEAGTLLVQRALDPPVAMPPVMLAWRDDPRPQLARVLELVRQVARELYAAGSQPAPSPG